MTPHAPKQMYYCAQLSTGLAEFIKKHAPSFEVEDLTQEVLLRVFCFLKPKLGTNFDWGSLQTRRYAYVVARERCADFNRTQATHRRLHHFVQPLCDGLPQQAPSVCRLEALLELNDLERLMKRSPDRSWAHLRMRALEGLSYAEMSLKLGISEEALRVSVCCGRARLRHLLNASVLGPEASGMSRSTAHSPPGNAPEEEKTEPLI